jgi:hypothetical protein
MAENEQTWSRRCKYLFYFFSEGWRGENKIVILLPKVGAYKTGNNKRIPIRGQFHKI